MKIPILSFLTCVSPKKLLGQDMPRDPLWQAAATAALRIIQATLRHLEAAAAIHAAGGCT